MKKTLYSLIAAIGIFGATSCSDMLDTESSRFVSDPDINNKTDSIFYAYGVMQAMQQLADQYFFQNEMRGELVEPTSKATTHLKELASFSAGVENKYDSVYLYYKVINNCNYYLAHRDTTLQTGGELVTIDEFAGIAAFRAWTYLQLTTQYGDVPYIEAPVTTISDINANTTRINYRQILGKQAEYLQELKNKYPAYMLEAPVYSGNATAVTMGNTNWGTQKSYIPQKCFLPFNVVLGDLYLELGEYEKAATCYFDYLRYQSEKYGIASIANGKYGENTLCNSRPNFRYDSNDESTTPPLDYDFGSKNLSSTNGWDRIFGISNSDVPNNTEVVSYIPMAVRYTLGQTTEIPQAFGYDYYSTTNRRYSDAPFGQSFITRCPESDEVQILPSKEFKDMAYNAPYYYSTTTKDLSVGTTRYIISSCNIGDGRINMIAPSRDADSPNEYVVKPRTGYILLYRNSTIYMHLAEALNRLDQPELAFAVLKTGLHDGIRQYVDTAYVEENKIPQENYFIPWESYDYLRSAACPYPFFSAENRTYFTNINKEIIGMRQHGSGLVEDVRSPYSYKSIVGAQIDKNRETFGISYQVDPNDADNPKGYTREEYINAVEDLLCEEYALEFAFEGRRFSDLLRLARHKNDAGYFGGAFGDRWLSKKLENKAPGITTANCYLPFK